MLSTWHIEGVHTYLYSEVYVPDENVRFFSKPGVINGEQSDIRNKIPKVRGRHQFGIKRSK